MDSNHRRFTKRIEPENRRTKRLVGPNGLEPSTSSVSRKRSNQLSYGPAIRLAFLFYRTRPSVGKKALSADNGLIVWAIDPGKMPNTTRLAVNAGTFSPGLHSCGQRFQRPGLL